MVVKGVLESFDNGKINSCTDWIIQYKGMRYWYETG